MSPKQSGLIQAKGIDKARQGHLQHAIAGCQPAAEGCCESAAAGNQQPAVHRRPQIRLTVVDRKGPMGCHRGHKPGDAFDYDTERGQVCPMALHAAFPYIDILRYGGTIPAGRDGDIRVCCPDADVMLHFRIEVVEE